MDQKYKKGDRVKVSIGQPIWQNNNGKIEWLDIHPEYKDDVATVEYTYGEMSEVDPKFSPDEQGYKQYCLNFDKYGKISWFSEHDILPI